MGEIFVPINPGEISVNPDNIFDNDLLPRDESEYKEKIKNIAKDSDLLQIPESVYGTIKRVGILNKKPILYGDPNLLRPGDLFYINGVKQVYRYCGAVKVEGECQYKFSTILSYTFSEDSVFTIPEDERGLIHRAGYLFNEIIYSGDPNMIDNGSLFYHSSLPFVSIVENNEGAITLSTNYINDDGEPETMYSEYKVNTEPHDYSGDYFTITNIGETEDDVEIQGVFSYNIDNADWQDSDGSEPITLQYNQKAQLRGLDFDEGITIIGPVEISGNIMSLVVEEDFEEALLEEDYQFSELFKEQPIVSAKNLILPSNVTEGCYQLMFKACEQLIEAPETLPATTLAESCYNGMFEDCVNLVKAPYLPALELVYDCYTYMFKGCESLNYIKAMFTTTPNNDTTGMWVESVTTDLNFGTFVKNLSATWNVIATTSNNYCGIPQNWTVKTDTPKTDPIEPKN